MVLEGHESLSVSHVSECARTEFEKSLGDIVLDLMSGNGASHMTLAELVYKVSDISEIRCHYHGRKYVIRFNNSEKIPQVEVHDVASGSVWLVTLKHSLLKRFYPKIASKLALAAHGDQVGIVSDSVRGGVFSAFKGIFRKFTEHFDFGIHDTMGPEEMSEFLGSRLFDPHRTSGNLEYIIVRPSSL